VMITDSMVGGCYGYILPFRGERKRDVFIEGIDYDRSAFLAGSLV
jgi:hypothetical protein